MSMMDSNTIFLLKRNCCDIVDLLRIQRILKCYNQSNDTNNTNDIDSNDNNNDNEVNANDSHIMMNDDTTLAVDNNMNINDDIEWLDSIIDDDTIDSINITKSFHRLSITNNKENITNNKENIRTTTSISNISKGKSTSTKKVNTITCTTNDDDNDYIDDNDIFNSSSRFNSKSTSISTIRLTSSTLPLQVNHHHHHHEPSSKNQTICNEVVKDFLRKKEKQPVMIAYSDKSCVSTYSTILDSTMFCSTSSSSSSNHTINSKFQRKSNMGNILYGGVLLITSKANVEKWADLCRMRTSTKLHCYTDSLKQRRQLGSNRLTQFDIVITTFEIARAKEIFIPLNRDSNDTADTNDPIDTNTTSTTNTDDSITWLPAKDSNQAMIERSNLHVLKWSTLIMDFDDMTIMKPTSLTGKALLSLQAGSSITLFKGPSLREPLPKSDIIAMKAITIRTHQLSSSTLDAR